MIFIVNFFNLSRGGIGVEKYISQKDTKKIQKDSTVPHLCSLPQQFYKCTRVCIKHTKSVKSVHSSRSPRASQSPLKVEKQPKSTPDMYNPPTHCSGEDHKYTYPRGHSLRLSGLLAEFCEDSGESQITSINAFYVTGLRSRFDQSEMVFHQIRCKISIFFSHTQLFLSKKVKNNTFLLLYPNKNRTYALTYMRLFYTRQLCCV